MLRPFGLSVMDSASADALESETLRRGTRFSASRPSLQRLPRLVYYRSTAETANAVLSLVRPRSGRRGVVEAGRCCALLDRAESVDALADAHDEAHTRHAELQAELRGGSHAEAVLPSGEGRHAGGAVGTAAATATADLVRQGPTIICTAVLYDDLLRQVRVWARLGHSPLEIQTELDARFARVADVLNSMRQPSGSGGSGKAR